MTASKLLQAACTLGIALAALPARAQGDPKVVAESLFRDAKKLMAEKNYAQACPMFAESQRLDPGGGTLLNLAACHEGEGKTASAWAEYSEALSAARRDGREDRTRVAEARIAALEPELPRLTLKLSDAARSTSPSVALDGVAIGATVLGLPTPIDPGTHKVTALAAGRKPFTATVELSPNTNKVLEIPALEEDPGAGANPPSPAPSPAPTPLTPVEADSPAPSHGGGTQRVVAFAIGGGGLAAIAAGGVLGLRAISLKSSSDSECNPGCTQAGVNDFNDGKTMANIATVGFAVGVVAIGVGVYLLVTLPADHQPTAHARGIQLLPAGVGGVF
jgi:hypothetical protein